MARKFTIIIIIIIIVTNNQILPLYPSELQPDENRLFSLICSHVQFIPAPDSLTRCPRALINPSDVSQF